MLSINTSTCRLCLTNENVTVDIFSSHYNYLSKKIQICLPITVTENDRLPKCICETCHNKVSFFYEFWNQTLQAERHFMSLLVTNNESVSQNLFSCNHQDDEVGAENLNAINNDGKNVLLCETALSNEHPEQKESTLKENNSDDDYHALKLSSQDTDDESEITTTEQKRNNMKPSSEENSPTVDKKPESKKCKYSDEVFTTSLLHSKHDKITRMKEDVEYACDKCHFTTYSKSSFTMHSKRHIRKYNVFCQECNVSFLNKSEMTLHNIQQHDAQPFQCAHCNDVFTSKNTLYSHIKSHDPSSVHICEICGKTYKKKNSYKRHINRNHLGMSAKAQCAICNRILSSKEHLRRHMLVHTDERNWVCSTCGKCYRSKCYLTEHSRIHAGIKPYKCEICSKCFTQRGSLTIHKRSHTGERPFRCEYCDRGFIISTLLRYHMKKCSLAPVVSATIDDNFENETIGVITINSAAKIESVITCPKNC